VTDDDIAEKFTALTTPAVGAERSRHLAGLVGRLEEMPDISALAAALCEPATHT